MRLQFILFLILVNTSFFTAFACKPKTLKCINATEQSFMGGAAGSPSGKKYRFTLIAPASSSDFSLDQVWVGDNYFNVTAYKQLPGNTSSEFSAKDTLIVEFTQLSSGSFLPEGMEESKKNPVQNKPFDYQGKALIGYKIGKQRKYLTVKAIQVLQRLNFQ